jgi:hypothetical protein
MEIHQNPLFFHENIFFLIRKSLNTPNSIFRANIRNLLLRERCLLAVELMLSMCLFHLRSDWIVTPRYFVEDSVWRVC